MQAKKKMESVSDESEEMLGAKLLDTIQTEFGARNDAAIARDLDMAPPVISKIRNGKAGVSGETIIRINEVYGMSIACIKKILRARIFDRKNKK